MKVGLVINPVAGLGGKTAHFGSDNIQITDRASVLGVEHLSHKRGMMFLNSLTSILTNEEWHCIDLVLSALPKDISDENWRGFVAQENVKELAWPQAEGGHATTQLCQQMISFNVDLLVFVGGDGTARDVLAAVGQQIPVLGVPAGVKMHSGVFAVTPVAAAKVLAQMIRGELVSRVEQDVRDFDNTSSGTETTHISVKTFGHMLVPESGQFMQHTKVGGIESEALVVQEVCAHIVEQFGVDYPGKLVFGPGSTVLAIKQAFGLQQGTLRGFDCFADGNFVHLNADFKVLESFVDEHTWLVMSFTRQQGFLLGRGNQQLTTKVLTTVGKEQTLIVGSRSKLSGLNGRPLLIDVESDHVRDQFCGVGNVVCGYEDILLHRIATELE